MTNTFNPYQMYAMQCTNSPTDECALVKSELDSLTQYSEILNFVKKRFEKVVKPHDEQIKKFKNTNKYIGCTMFEDETLFFYIKSEKSTDLEWTKLMIKS